MTDTERIGRLVTLAIGICAAVVAILLLSKPSRDLTVVKDRVHGLPVRFVAPPGETQVPAVLLAHGFAGTGNMMRGYANTLGYAGIATVSWDFSGHGGNATPLSTAEESLKTDIDTAVAYLRERPEVDLSRVGILGHSMGSGAAMAAGIEHPDIFSAVVAVSPTGAAVTSTLPNNLQLQAGTLEPRFLENARELLAQAGGEREGENARALVPVDGVEHISILYSSDSQQAALKWFASKLLGLSESAGDSREPLTARGVQDPRPIWYALFVAGWIVAVQAIGPWISRVVPDRARRGRDELPAVRGGYWQLKALTSAAFATAVVLVLAVLLPDLTGSQLSEIAKISVAPAVALWFVTFGAFWLLWSFRPALPLARSAALGVGVFIILWVSIGLAGNYVAFNWILTPQRLAWWLPFSLSFIPWFLSAGYGYATSGRLQALGWFALQSVVVVGALAIVGLFAPGLFFVTLLLPVIPVLFGATTLTAMPLRDPWAFGIGNALFFGWLLAAVFPMTT